jgi:glycosyltransferase involved in cell wall biosynthesis
MDGKIKVLFINKFLYPKGGSETYMFNLAEYLEKEGHSVSYFGMRDAKNTVSENHDLMVSNVDFKDISVKKLYYPFKIIYSKEARAKIRELLQSIKPDIVHLNNYNFQITPSILYEIRRYNIPVVMTLHDFQIVCPNHMLYLEHKKMICEDCRGRRYSSCISNRCIHNSRLKSLLGMLEAQLYYRLKTYNKCIDTFISPSDFLKCKIVEFGEKENRIKVIPNFVNSQECKQYPKKDYIIYFGRLSVQKGIHTLLEACKSLPHIDFVLAGSGDIENDLPALPNLKYVGQKSGKQLEDLIGSALFSVYPSEWYENCPMSILESQFQGTPVVGANIGGIPELVDDGIDGLLFSPGDTGDLIEKITLLYESRERLQTFSNKCREKIVSKYSADKYYNELMKVYRSAIDTHKIRNNNGGSEKCLEELYTDQL